MNSTINEELKPYGELKPFETSTEEEITELICHPFKQNWYAKCKRFLLKIFVFPFKPVRIF
jgi:hypothetical protein